MTKRLFNKTRQAMTLIEVMVAVTLVSIIFTTIAVVMVYTQKTIKEAQNRAKAVDAANSCLQRFRIARDSNNWVNFCQKLKVCHDNNYFSDHSKVGCEFPIYEVYDPITGECRNCGADYTLGNLTIPEAVAKFSDHEICPEVNLETKDGDFHATYEIEISVCDHPNSADLETETAAVKIKLNYLDFSGNQQVATVQQQFARNEDEARYKL
jgi:prepilin-type N-terminal cleavage/methylation domain-containing protein